MASEMYGLGDHAPGTPNDIPAGWVVGPAAADASAPAVKPNAPGQAAPSSPPPAGASDIPAGWEVVQQGDPPPPPTPGPWQQAASAVSHVVSGFGAGAADTLAGVDNAVSKIPGVGKFLTTPLVGGKTSEQAITDEKQAGETNNNGEKIGAGLEGILEFMGGDEALKGLSLSDRMGKLSKVAKALEDHPYLAKIAQIGTNAARQGTVGTAQGMLHGDTVGQAVGRGAATAAGGAALDGLVSGAHAVAARMATAPMRGFVGLINEGKAGMGDNFDAEGVAHDIAPLVQQAAKANPQLVKQAMSPESSPKQVYEAMEEILQEGKQKINEAHQEALGSVKNAPISTKVVQQAISKTAPEGLEKYGPEDAAAIKALQQRVGKVSTLGELNGLRAYLTTELAPSFKMDGVAVARSGAVDKAMRAALGSTRDAYYDALQQATGQDFQGLKRLESQALTGQEALANAKAKLLSAQATAERPQTAKQTVGRVVEAAASPMKGKKAIAQSVLNEKPMDQSVADIRRFLKHIPDHVPDSFERGSGPAGGGPGGGSPPEPQPSLGSGTSLVRGQRPGSVQVDTQNGLPARPQAPALPGGATRQLPATASAEGRAPVGNSKPYPALDPRFTRTRIEPTRFDTPQQQGPNPVTVDPQGNAALKTPPRQLSAKASEILGGKKKVRKPSN